MELHAAGALLGGRLIQGCYVLAGWALAWSHLTYRRLRKDSTAISHTATPYMPNIQSQFRG
jgi:hypothetical protein